MTMQNQSLCSIHLLFHFYAMVILYLIYLQWETKRFFVLKRSFSFHLKKSIHWEETNRFMSNTPAEDESMLGAVLYWLLIEKGSYWSSFFSSVKNDFQELVSSVKSDAINAFEPISTNTKSMFCVFSIDFIFFCV